MSVISNNTILGGVAAATMLALIPSGASAQSAVDSYNLAKNELRGTARFMGMGGAFTALGGDLSTLTQNPAGIGVYRGSEIGFTLDVNMLSTKSSEVGRGFTQDNTHVDVNNVGYIGTFNLGNSVAQTFSWGFSYGRQQSFERAFSAGAMPLQTSLSNYVANYTAGTMPSDMNFDNGYKGYDPYQNSDINWLSILSYSAGAIQPFYDKNSSGEYVPNGNYSGMFEYPNEENPDGTVGSADVKVRQRGYVDEYSINFGGNLANTVYWGLGIGITDLDFEQTATYTEGMQRAIAPNQDFDGISYDANATMTLSNWQKITGTGVNVKFGLIFKPVNELRIGFAVHSPTYYNMHTTYNAEMAVNSSTTGFSNSDYTNTADYNWNYKSPWRMMFGLAGVVGGRFILSADYEYQALNTMTTSDNYGDFDLYNQDVKDYYKPVNTLRVGAEFRVTPQFSLRLGYNYSSTGVKSEVADSSEGTEVYTAGCNPGYTTNNSTSNVTAGLGYRIGGFYVDMAYVHTARKSTYHCFTPFYDYDGVWSVAPTAKLTDNDNRLVFSIGYKF